MNFEPNFFLGLDVYQFHRGDKRFDLGAAGGKLLEEAEREVTDDARVAGRRLGEQDIPLRGEPAKPHVGRLPLVSVAIFFCQTTWPSAAPKQISCPRLPSVNTWSPSTVGVPLGPPA